VSEQPWSVQWSAEGHRSLNKLPSLRVIDAVFALVEGPLTENPMRLTKPLRPPYEEERSARVGAYRVLVEVDPDARVVTIMRVLHRADAYRPR
jgi:mRNA interferase RelE/StbE